MSDFIQDLKNEAIKMNEVIKDLKNDILRVNETIENHNEFIKDVHLEKRYSSIFIINCFSQKTKNHSWLSGFLLWYREQDSNLHTEWHLVLSQACLPIPSSRHSNLFSGPRIRT